MKYSKYQLDIFDFVKNGEGHAVVEAVAGSGKTTTIIDAMKYIPIHLDVLFICFNKHIAVELQKRVPFNATAATLNSFGWSICRSQLKQKITLDQYKTDSILRKLTSKFNKFKFPVSKLISLFKALNSTDLETIASNYDINLPDDKDFESVLKETYAKTVQMTSVMDFDDQIFMPIHYNLPIQHYDFVFVDEAQDLSPIQIEFVKRIGSGGRIIAVGDSRQAIYGFRGSDPNSIKNIITALDAKTLPLTISYRCPKKVVAEAQKVVSHIEAFEDSPQGVVANVTDKVFDATVTAEDYVLCRTTAPLVQKCLDMIAQGRKATVKGRDIGQQLIQLLDKAGGFDNLLNYQAEQNVKWEKLGRDGEIQKLDDKVQTLIALNGDRNKIEQIFSDDVKGIMFCTVHRAKGLENKRVFILKPELLPHPRAKRDWEREQELNLKYVAITRSMGELYYVTS